MFSSLTLLIALVALLVGSGVAWFWARRPLAQAQARAADMEVQAATAQAQFKAAVADIRREQDRALAAEAELAAIRAELGQARIQIAALESGTAAREAGWQAQVAQLEGLRADLAKLLEHAAGQALSQSQEAFLRMANESFAAHRDTAGVQLAGLVQPIADQLKRAEDQIGAIETARADAYGALREQINGMRIDQEKVRHEAARLTQALRGSAKMRGNWGESQLRNVLEMAGLSQFTDFRTELSVDSDDGRQRPDAVVRLPGGRSLVIDAKTSLVAFQAASEADDEMVKRTLLGNHAAALKTHATQLGQKSYWKQFDDAPDFVVMFVPGEHFLHAALEVDPELWEYAFERQVLIASPINLIALARTVAQVWRQETMAKTAREIGEVARELFKRLVKLGTQVERMGKSIHNSVDAYNGFLGTLESSVLPQARKFNELGVDDSGQVLPVIQPIDLQPRTPAPNRDLQFERSSVEPIRLARPEG